MGQPNTCSKIDIPRISPSLNSALNATALHNADGKYRVGAIGSIYIFTTYTHLMVSFAKQFRHASHEHISHSKKTYSE